MRVGFAVAFMLLAIIVVTTYQITNDLIKNNSLTTHTYEVITKLETTISLLVDAETGHRGYVITGDEKFLEPYYAATPHIEATISELRRLTSDNPSQQQRMPELERRSATRLAIIKEVIELRRRNEIDAATQIIKSGSGKVEMDAVRRIIKEMQEEEQRLLKVRLEKSQLATRKAIVAFTVMTFLIVALLGLSYYVINRDFDRQEQKKKLLRELSLTDDLTGLYNRRGFLALANQQLKQVHRANKSLMLLYADMDGLKQINDRYGHEEGSKAIVKVAEILNHTFRESDIIARLGGDEFAIMVVDANDDSLEFLAARMQSALKEYNAQRFSPYDLSMSIGATKFERGCSIEDLITRADEAMYRNKRNRRRA
jgi:diguanylate cyclase (GGDEF)-like protein